MFTTYLKKIKRLSLSLLIFGFCLFALSAWAQNAKTALLLDMQGVIGPAAQDYVHRGLLQANAKHAIIVILRLDTPGGLDKSMRNIVRDIISSPIPVATFVAPGGARAASAGTYILYASQIAAMAPGTNLGAATPVSVAHLMSPKKEDTQRASTVQTKAKNDAAAYLRGLAQLNNRNAEWAEKAVVEAASLSATEALKLGVIDFIAADVPDLLKQSNGRTVTVLGQKQILNTTNLTVDTFAPDWYANFLNIITDPNIAYLLMILGVWCLFFEFAHPGFILPGIVGVIALLLALYAFQLLPINYVGLGLILLGIIFMIAEAFLSSFGVLGVGGIAAFAIGSILLLEPNVPGYAIAIPLILAVGIFSAGFFLLIANLAIKARSRPVVSGREELVGKKATIIIDEENRIWAHLHGERWQVRSTLPLEAGQMVKVIGLDGIVLLVKPLS